MKNSTAEHFKYCADLVWNKKMLRQHPTSGKMAACWFHAEPVTVSLRWKMISGDNTTVATCLQQGSRWLDDIATRVPPIESSSNVIDRLSLHHPSKWRRWQLDTLKKKCCHFRDKYNDLVTEIETLLFVCVCVWVCVVYVRSSVAGPTVR